MSDAPSDPAPITPLDSSAPVPPSVPPTAPGGRPPLTPVTLIFPGRAHSQMWLFLWFGVAYMVGSLLPWDGFATRTQVLLDQSVESYVGIATNDSPRTTSLLPLGEFEHKQRQGALAASNATAITDSNTMGLGRFLILLGGIATTVLGAASIFTRRLAVGALVATWFLALVVVWFHKGYDFAGTNGVLVVGFLDQFGAMFGAVFGNFGALLGSGLPREARDLLGRMGIGWYIVALSQVIILVVILLSLFTGGKKADPAGASKAGGSAGRPGRR